MGAKRPSVRTLKSGEKITHYPDGRQILHPATQVRDRLQAGQAELAWYQAERRDDSELRAMREKMITAGVPSDKRPI